MERRKMFNLIQVSRTEDRDREKEEGKPHKTNLSTI